MSADIERSSQRLLFPGPAGDLEAEWQRAVGEARGSAVVLHPHPLYGGTMDNAVVLEAARALVHRGLDTLRFNFRGVGRSSGEHDGGAGEQRDLAAAFDLCVERASSIGQPGSVWLAGYSFGAAVLLRSLAARPSPVDAARGALLLAPPVTHYDFSAAGDSAVPLAVLCGSHDDLTPKEAIEACRAQWLRPRCLEWIEGAGHDLGSYDQPRSLRAALAIGLDSLALPGEPGVRESSRE